MLRAIAVATDTSDVVGTVDLACEEAGLSLHFVRASAYAASYVPALPAQRQRVVVPYEAVRELCDDGETLRLTLASARIPHRRLVLAHFTRDGRDDARRVHRRRRKAQAAVAAGAAGAAALVGLVGRWMGALPGALLGAVVTFAAVGGGVLLAQEVGRQVVLGGAESMAERRAFFHELSQRLRLAGVKALVVDEAAPALGAATAGALTGALRGAAVEPSTDRGPLAELLPVLGAVGAAALVALVALTTGRSVVSGGEPPAASTALPAAAVAPQPPPSVAPVDEAPLGLCMCQGPSSPYIPTTLPRLTVLPRVERLRLDPKRPSISVEVAVVNNSAEPLRDVKGDVAFLLPGRHPGDPPRVHREEGFYYEGPLRGGHAVKWRLGGRGTSYRVHSNFDEAIDEAQLAPADAFAELLSAHTRSVRVHGAMMLARMRDERAPAAVARLREGAADEEARVLDSLARAAAPTYACEVEPAHEGDKLTLSACLMNTTEEEAGPVDAVATVLSRPPPGEEPATVVGVLRRRVLIPAKTGVRVQGELTVPSAMAGARIEVSVDPSRLTAEAHRGKPAPW